MVCFFAWGILEFSHLSDIFLLWFLRLKCFSRAIKFVCFVPLRVVFCFLYNGYSRAATRISKECRSQQRCKLEIIPPIPLKFVSECLGSMAKSKRSASSLNLLDTIFSRCIKILTFYMSMIAPLNSIFRLKWFIRLWRF